MSGQQYSVEISVGVIEKLAGLRKPVPKPAAPVLGSPFAYGGNPEVIALAKNDATLSKALATSQRVGSVLLKQEEQEVVAVKKLTQDLLKKHNYPAQDVPCGSAREAVLACYAANPEDSLKCSEQVASYSECAGRVYNEYVKRVNAARRG